MINHKTDTAEYWAYEDSDGNEVLPSAGELEFIQWGRVAYEIAPNIEEFVSIGDPDREVGSTYMDEVPYEELEETARYQFQAAAEAVRLGQLNAMATDAIDAECEVVITWKNFNGGEDIQCTLLEYLKQYVPIDSILLFEKEYELLL